VSTIDLQHPSEVPAYLRGWAISFLVHATAVALGIALVSDLRLAPRPEVFKWDVAVLDPPKPMQQEQPKPSKPQPQAAPAPSPLKPAKAQPVEQEPVVQTVQAVQRVEHVVHREVRTVAESAPSVERTAESLAKPAYTSQAVVQTGTVVTKGSQVSESASVASTKSQAVTHEATAISKNHVTETVVSTSEPAAVSQPLIAAIQTAATSGAPATDRQVVARQPSPPTAPLVAPKALKEVPLHSTPAAKADYSWLADALYKSVEQHKGYPHLARTNRWEGQVTMMIVLGQAGPSLDLLDVKVVESSGYTLLDTHALEVIRGVFPLQVKHRLQQARVSVRVPISFRINE
jgi:TonB family protein